MIFRFSISWALELRQQIWKSRLISYNQSELLFFHWKWILLIKTKILMYYKPYLVKKITIFGISIEPAGTDISAAILVNLAVNAEIPPSALLTPKVSKRQNKYKKLLNIKGPRDCRRDPGLTLVSPRSACPPVSQMPSSNLAGYASC